MKLGSVGGLLIPAPDADPNLGRIDKAVELGMSVISIGFRENRDHGYMQTVAEYAAKKGIELRTGGGGTFGSANPDERKEAVERNINNLLELSEFAGIKYGSLANGPMSHNRWAPVPPMSERIDMIAEGIAAVADGIASAGIRVGLENHCDYRGHEIAAMIAKANRPNLGAQIDTGNAFTVFEEPVECTKAMAKWVTSSHFKDVQVIPLSGAPYYGSRCIDCEFGKGSVDLVACCEILQKESPDPKSLALMVEPLTLPPDVDRDQYIRTAVAWIKKNLAQFLT